MEVKFNKTIDLRKEKLEHVMTNTDYCCDEDFAIVYTSEGRISQFQRNPISPKSVNSIGVLTFLGFHM